VICTLARLEGHLVAVVANQARVLADSLDSDGADRAAHFTTVADSYHLPIVFLADNPGVVPGSQSVQQGILRSGARMYPAQTQARVPKMAVTLRKAYGFGSMVMVIIPFDGQSATFSFPGATTGAMGAAAMSRARKSVVDEATHLRQLGVEASYRSARSFGQDELISPVEPGTGSSECSSGPATGARRRRCRPPAPPSRRSSGSSTVELPTIRGSLRPGTPYFGGMR
jgi:acetyl-CoA carboxylase carboxyltransferase component